MASTQHVNATVTPLNTDHWAPVIDLPSITGPLIYLLLQTSQHKFWQRQKPWLTKHDRSTNRRNPNSAPAEKIEKMEPRESLCFGWKQTLLVTCCNGNASNITIVPKRCSIREWTQTYICCSPTLGIPLARVVSWKTINCWTCWACPSF